MERRLMIMMMWLLAITMAKAQSGLNIAPLFEGKIIPQERMVETRVKGKINSLSSAASVLRPRIKQRLVVYTI